MNWNTTWKWVPKSCTSRSPCSDGYFSCTPCLQDFTFLNIKLTTSGGCSYCILNIHLYMLIGLGRKFGWSDRVTVNGPARGHLWFTLSFSHFSDCGKMSPRNRSAPYCSNPPFYDVLTSGHYGVQVSAPDYPNAKNFEKKCGLHQCGHTGILIFNFWHRRTLALTPLRAEHQSAPLSTINKMVVETSMALDALMCNHLAPQRVRYGPTALYRDISHFDFDLSVLTINRFAAHHYRSVERGQSCGHKSPVVDVVLKSIIVEGGDVLLLSIQRCRQSLDKTFYQRWHWAATDVIDWLIDWLID